MPSRPKHPCNYPGCDLLTSGRYCDRHGMQVRRAQEATRETASQRGYDHRWHKASKRYLKEHPLCAECERQGKIKAAALVDHIKPHKGDRDLFGDERNWQPLCTPCHNIKTAKEDGGFGNKIK